MALYLVAYESAIPKGFLNPNGALLSTIEDARTVVRAAKLQGSSLTYHIFEVSEREIDESDASHRSRAIEVFSALGEPTDNISDSHVERIIATAREAEIGVKTTDLHRRMASEIPVETLHFVATGGGR